MRESTNKPKVSIGLAVYNGGKYLEEAIDSILAQTFTDFELIISDNASTDNTAEICHRYANQDSRIRYHRNAENIGGANNHNLTFKLAKGEYFRWAAHDDVCEPDLIAKCAEVLDRDPSVVLCHTQVVEIDEKGIRKKLIGRNNGSSSKPHERFATIACSRDFCEETYGLIRSEIFGKTGLQKNYTASDRTLLSEISLYGKFYEVPEPLFLKRIHPGNTYIDWRARMAWFDNNFKGRIVFPFWIQFFDYLATIKQVPVSGYTKIRCYLSMAKWLRVFGKNMVKDVIVAIYMLIHSTEWRKKRYENTDNWT